MRAHERHLLKSKIHRATVTDANVDYEGSIEIDSGLMEKANILPYERVQVLSIDTGARLETYAIPGPKDSGVICINGAAARKVGRGELVIILTYTWVPEEEAIGWDPTVVLVDGDNKPQAKK